MKKEEICTSRLSGSNRSDLEPSPEARKDKKKKKSRKEAIRRKSDPPLPHRPLRQSPQTQMTKRVSKRVFHSLVRTQKKFVDETNQPQQWFRPAFDPRTGRCS